MNNVLLTINTVFAVSALTSGVHLACMMRDHKPITPRNAFFTGLSLGYFLLSGSAKLMYILSDW